METKQLTPEQIALLKKPLPAAAVSRNESAPHLASMKAIYIIERLNEVFGVGGWRVHNEPVETSGAMIVVRATFHAPAYGIVIPDIFGGNDNPDRGDAYKGACTDALTKIASYLYIGMDIYKGSAFHGAAPTMRNNSHSVAEQKRTPAESDFAERNRLKKTILSYAETNYATRLGIAKELKRFAAASHTSEELRGKLRQAKEFVALNRHTLL